MPLPKNENKHNYTADLPSGRKVKYHPWIVRDEQEYMYATEGMENKDDMVPHIEELLSKCITDETLINQLSEVDFLALAVEVRKKSKGETHDIVFTCPYCETLNEGVQINLIEDVVSEGMNLDPIEVGDSEFTFHDVSRENLAKIKAMESDAKRRLYFMIYSLAGVTTPEQTYTKFSVKETVEFFETMDPKEFKILSKEFAGVLPTFVVKKKLSCQRCEKETMVFVDKVSDFFV